MASYILVFIATLLPLFAASQQESIPGHLAYVRWNMPNVPLHGLRDITFPMSIKNAIHEKGWYFAQEFKFIGTSHVGYTGLQPRPDVGSETIIHAVFSSFVNGTISQDVNCHDGADGGPGVSCAVDLPGNYSNMYHLRVQNTQGTTWNGTLIDTATGIETHIGSYTLPTGSLGIQGSKLGFVEWWPFNNGLPATCESLSQTSVVFGVPTTSTEGVGPGELENAYEVYDCAGKQDFQSQRLLDGVEVKVGFKKSLDQIANKDAFGIAGRQRVMLAHGPTELKEYTRIFNSIIVHMNSNCQKEILNQRAIFGTHGADKKIGSYPELVLALGNRLSSGCRGNFMNASRQVKKKLPWWDYGLECDIRGSDELLCGTKKYCEEQKYQQFFEYYDNPEECIAARETKAKK